MAKKIQTLLVLLAISLSALSQEADQYLNSYFAVQQDG
jgi:hypothetical protein